MDKSIQEFKENIQDLRAINETSFYEDRIDERERCKIELNNHLLVWTRDCSAIECLGCGEEKEVSELFQETTAERRLAYKWYLFAQFADMECDKVAHELEQHDDGEDSYPSISGQPIYWSDIGNIVGTRAHEVSKKLAEEGKTNTNIRRM